MKNVVSGLVNTYYAIYSRKTGRNERNSAIKISYDFVRFKRGTRVIINLVRKTSKVFDAGL